MYDEIFSKITNCRIYLERTNFKEVIFSQKIDLTILKACQIDSGYFILCGQGIEYIICLWHFCVVAF